MEVNVILNCFIQDLCARICMVHHLEVLLII
jgi:hypothetical protein